LYAESKLELDLMQSNVPGIKFAKLRPLAASQ